jgi:hypothetical protein
MTVTVTVRNAGDSFVARSTARRMMDAYGGASTVLLDFAGVPSISRSFADEVFRVWSSEHPRTNIAVHNMTAEVEAIIRAKIAEDAQQQAAKRSTSSNSLDGFGSPGAACGPLTRLRFISGGRRRQSAHHRARGKRHPTVSRRTAALPSGFSALDGTHRRCKIYLEKRAGDSGAAPETVRYSGSGTVAYAQPAEHT